MPSGHFEKDKNLGGQLFILDRYEAPEQFWCLYHQMNYSASFQPHYNGKKKKDKRTNNDLQNTHKTKDRVTRTQLKTGGEIMCSGRVSSSCSTNGTHRVNLVTNPVIIPALLHHWCNKWLACPP